MVIFYRFNWILRSAVRQYSCKRIGSDMDVLLPPKIVRGMTNLDRNMFKKTVPVPRIYTSHINTSYCLNILKPYLLKLFNFKPVQNLNDAERLENSTKIVFLDPRKISSFEDFNDEVKNQLKLIKIDESSMSVKEFTIEYDNWKADEILRAVIPSEFQSVSGYSLIGHIVHLNLRPHLDEYKNLIGEVLLDKIPNARTIITKSSSIESEFRNFKLELLKGDNDFVAKIKESGCTFELDFSAVYWNPRLSTEHSYVVTYLKKGDVLFDVFAGIGPFAIPAAKKGVEVFANDLNPDSIFWFKRNLEINKTSPERVHVTNKDGALFIKEDFKSNYLKLNKGNYKILITMNLPSLANNFIPHFRGLFSLEDKDIVTSLPTPEAFVYCFTKNAEDPKATAKKLVEDQLDVTNSSEMVGEPHFVRDVAPNKDMYRVPLTLTHEFLMFRKRPASPPDNDCVSKRSNI